MTFRFPVLHPKPKKMHEDSEAPWVRDIQAFAFLNDLGFNYSPRSRVALRVHLACILLMSSVAPTAQWKPCIWCLGWQAWGTYGKSLWLWSLPERMAAPSTALERSHCSSLVTFLFCFAFICSFLSFSVLKRLLCFNPCLSKRFFLIWKPICFGSHRSCLWCDGSCWKSPKEYLCSQLEVEAKLRMGAQGSGWLGWQLLPLWRE